MNSLPRVAWFSCVAERQSCGAYLTRTLLPILKESFEIECFTSDESHPGLAVPTFHYLTAALRHAERPFELFVYHLEDLKAAGFVRIQLALMPGIVLFHDLLLTDDGPEPILNSAWEIITRRFLDDTVPWPDRHASFTRPKPHAVRELAYALVPVFLSEKDRREFHRVGTHTLARGLGQEARDYFLPYPAPRQADQVYSSRPETVSNERAHFGTAPRSHVTLAFCGAPQVEARAHLLLQAIARTAKVNLVWMVQNSAEQAKAEALIADLVPKLGSSDRITFEFGATPEDWLKVARSADLAAHLHFSVYGKPGPFLATSMASGLPCLITDFGASRFIPDELVAKIQPGEAEVLEIAAWLEAFCDGRWSPRSAEIANWALENHSPRAVAEDLKQIFHNSLPLEREFLARWNVLMDEARRALCEEAGIETESSSTDWFESVVRKGLPQAEVELKWR